MFSPSTFFPPCLPQNIRAYVVGDIHGRLDLLTILLNDISRHNFFAREVERRFLIFLGDYIDRGPDSKSLLDLMINGLPPDFQVIPLKGNHEDVFVRFLDGDLVAGLQWLVRFGGRATLQSYGAQFLRGVPLLEEMEEVRHILQTRVIPKSHQKFLRTLERTHQIGDYFFVHAGVRPGVRLDQQNEEDTLWIRDDFLRYPGYFEKMIIHGHTISRMPDIRANRIGIDLGAFSSGNLCCLVLEEENRKFLIAQSL
ncbi:serine/threonine protein phosphatase 1 [Azospirillaceae bacterium]